MDIIENAEVGTVHNPYCVGCNDYTLEKFLLTAVFAGKWAHTQQAKLNQFLEDLQRVYPNWTPLKALARQRPDEIRLGLLMVRMGQYTRRTQTLAQLSRAVYPSHGTPLDLHTCSPEALEKIHGLGMKTSRFFIMHSRKSPDYAVLDAHILAYMRTYGVADSIPKSTPTEPKEYARLEAAWLRHCQELNKHPGELGFTIWLAGNRGAKIKLAGEPSVD